MIQLNSLNKFRHTVAALMCLSMSACSSVSLSALKLHALEAARTASAPQQQQQRGDELEVTETDQAPAFASLAPIETVQFEAGQARLSPISFQPAESRRGVVNLGRVGEPVSEIVTPTESVHNYPDEFLFDGGDRGQPVHYEGNLRSGLNTEDTVGEYIDHTGERHTRVSNRVAIYAPRFSAVRTISGTEERYHVNRVAGAHRTQGELRVAARKGLQIHTDSDSPGGLRIRSRPSGLNSDSRDTHISTVFRRAVHVNLQQLFEDRQFAQRAVFERTNSAWLADGLNAAKAWTNEKSVSITASTSGAIEVKAKIKPQEMVGIDDGKRTKGTLRIMKIADRKVAVPGDEITFTIRYDNLGDHDLYDVVIVDNLTPRLQFVEDSDASNRPGELVIEENGHGSHILKFIIDDPLPGHEGGVLQFKTTVQ